MSTQPSAQAWKGVDDALRLIERVSQLLKPLHRDTEVAGIGALLRLRQRQAYYVYGVSGAVPKTELADMPLPGAAHKVMVTHLRPGVLLLDETAARGVCRHFCDVRSGADEASARREPTAPMTSEDVPAEEFDPMLSAFGAARQAWFSIDEVQRILAREVDALDRLIERLKEAPPPAATSAEDLHYLSRLDLFLAGLITEERDRLRDREALQRNFFLTVRTAVAQVDASSVTVKNKGSAIDRFRPAILRSVIGKTLTDVRLRDDTINAIVASIEAMAAQAAQDRVYRLTRSIEKVETGQFGRHFGRPAELWLQQPQSGSRKINAVHEAIAAAGRGFHVKFERLGAVNRVMRARMEIAGLLMLAFLFMSAFDIKGTVRDIISIATLIIAVIIAAFSYLTSHLVEAERLDEELQRLREQLAKAGAEAAMRNYSALLFDAIERLEELRGELGARLAAQQPSSRFARTQISAPAAVAILTGLRSELAREMSGTTGPAAIKKQIAQLLAPTSVLRSVLR
jgi:hypothetical protein